MGDEEWAWLAQWRWRALPDRRKDSFYACRNMRTEDRWITVLMHRVILGLQDPETGASPENCRVDHINGDGLDNRLTNLRRATHSQNGANQRLRAGTKTGYKGVYSLPSGRFGARIRVQGLWFHLGTYPTAIEAALAYNAEAVVRFGIFAYPNPLYTCRTVSTL